MRTRCGVLVVACVCLAGLCAGLCRAQIAVQPPPVKIEVIKLQYADCEEIAALFGGGSTRGYGMERYLGQGWGRGFGMMGLTGPSLWSPPTGPVPGSNGALGSLLPEGMAGPPVTYEPLNVLIGPGGIPVARTPQSTPAGGSALNGIFPGLRVVAYPPLNALVVWGTADQINAFADP